MDQRKTALFDHSARTDPVSQELNNKEAYFACQFVKAEDLFVEQVTGMRFEGVQVLGAERALNTVQVDAGVKRLEGLAVVGQRVELKHLHLEFLHVLHLKVEFDSLVHAEFVFCLRGELQLNGVLHLEELGPQLFVHVLGASARKQALSRSFNPNNIADCQEMGLLVLVLGEVAVVLKRKVH